MTYGGNSLTGRQGVDHRDAARLEILGQLQAEVMVYQPLSIKEISSGGVLAETSFPLQLDSLHDFRLTLGDRSIVVKGRVVHSTVSEMDQEVVLYRSGVEFVDVPEHVSSTIDGFLTAVRDGRRAL